MTTPASTTPPREATETPSIKPQPPSIGHVVLVRIDDLIWRPMMVVDVHPDGSLTGTIFCDAGDHMRPAFRGWQSPDGGRISGRPDRLLAIGYGELLTFGQGIGQWIPRAQQGGLR